MKKYFFSDITDLKTCIDVSEQFEFDSFAPHLKRSAIRYLRNDLGIGKELFDELLTAYNEGFDSMDDEQKELLSFLRPVLANFAMYHYVPKAPLNFGAEGLNKITREGREAVKKWEREDAQKSFLDDAFQDLESLLEYLEENKDDFETWSGSQAYTVYKESFINTVFDFAREFPMVQSRRTFLAIKPIIRRIEDNEIKTVLGTTAYDALKLKIKNNTSLSDTEKTTITLIKPALANLVMKDAFMQLMMVINERGLQVLSSQSNTDSGEVSSPAPNNALTKLEWDAETKGRADLQKLNAFVNPASDREDPNDINNRIYIL